MGHVVPGRTKIGAHLLWSLLQNFSLWPIIPVLQFSDLSELLYSLVSSMVAQTVKRLPAMRETEV